MDTSNNSVVDNFIFETLLINPIEDIISKLELDKFRDCDIEWLNKRLEKFTLLALEIVGKEFILGKVNATSLNKYAKDKFLHYFRTLLDFFKSV